jgi:hypothetical protein
MDGMVCPYCQERSDESEIWARIGGETVVDPETPIIQLLLDDETEPEEEDMVEDMEFMATLRPCGHSFPRDELMTVEDRLQRLDELLEKHTESTNAFEIQLLRGEIHAVREKLDIATKRCKEQADATPPP